MRHTRHVQSEFATAHLNEEMALYETNDTLHKVICRRFFLHVSKVLRTPGTNIAQNEAVWKYLRFLSPDPDITSKRPFSDHAFLKKNETAFGQEFSVSLCLLLRRCYRRCWLIDPQ